MNKRRTFIAVLLLIGGALLSFALPVFAADESPIRWGVVSTLQGEAGIGAKAATLMAADEINAKGGILGRKVECYFADDGANPEGGISAVKKLIYEDKVDFISGGFLSGVGLAEAPHIFAAKKLWLSAGPASPKFAELVQKDYENAKYFFRVGPLNSNYTSAGWADAVNDLFAKGMGLKKVAILAESSVWSRETLEQLKELLAKKGMEVVYYDVFDPQRTDFSPQFSKIRSSGAQVMTGIQAASTGVALTKQWAETELPVHQVGYNMMAQSFNYWEKTGGKSLAEGTLMANGGRAPLSPTTIPFFDKFMELYKFGPTYTAFSAYDALYLLKAAAEKANSLDTDALIKTLENIEYVGVAGLIRYDKSHDLIYDPTFQRGKGYVFIQWQGPHTMAVIWPTKFATAPYMNPPWLNKK
jgi:branched-chain amino acid transport system substrate-binding protein